VPTLDYTEFLVIKAWSLLHDPPDKAWNIQNHEERAKSIFQEIFRGTEFGGGVPSENVIKVVKTADIWASSFDRWLILHSEELSRHFVEFYDILNIFDPSKRAYNNAKTEKPSNDVVENFTNKIREIIQSVDDAKLRYHTLYAILEYVWAKCWPFSCPADTRFPTHTVFDHVYATATISNLFIHRYFEDSETPRGYLIYIDIPGIQQFVNAARKTADYWAGSWLISYLAWSTVEELVLYLGPDILILPTARHNLMYKQWLLKLIEQHVKTDKKVTDIIETIRSVWGSWFTKAPHPVIPATLSLLIPKFDKVTLNIELIDKIRNSEKLKEYLIQKYREGWERLVDCGKELKNSKDVLERFIGIIFEKHENIIKYSYPQHPRIVIIDIEEVYNNYINDIKKYIDEEKIHKIEEIFKKYKELLDELKIDKLEVIRKMFYHILFSNILSQEILKLKSRGPYNIPLSERLSKITEDKYRQCIEEKEETWRYCTTCGIRPSILHLPRDLSECREKIKEILSESTEDVSDRDIEKIEKIMIYFKCGEYVCPICLVKRALRFLIERTNKFMIDTSHLKTESTEVLSNRLIIDYILRPALEDRCKKEKEGYEEIFDRLDWLLCRLVDGTFSYDLGNIFNMSTNELRRQLNSKIRNIFEEVRSKGLIDADYGIFIEKRPQLRMYYAIVKGDGDSMGDLLIGKLPLKACEYAERIKDIVYKYVKQKIASKYSNILDFMAEIADALDTSIIISPVYHASLSAAMMVTAVKDAMIVAERRGTVVYAGGDDIVALTPVETALMIVVETRKNYWAVDTGYFHRYDSGGLVVPALVAYGRSYGVRIAHVMDPMQTEIDIATKLLEDSKDTKWDLCSEKFSKDTLTISYGRTSIGEVVEEAKIPLRSGCSIGVFVELLHKLWKYTLNDIISHGLAIDYENMYRDTVETLYYDKNMHEIINKAISRLLERNIKVSTEVHMNDVLDALRASTRIIDECSRETLLTHIMRGLRFLRNLPR